MASKLKSRPTQTKVKHDLLDAYLSRWGRIIINGVKRKAREAQARGRVYDMHMVYVDTHAFTGRYAGELEDEVSNRLSEPVYGSAIIGIKALDRLAAWASDEGVPIRTNVILIEKVRQNFRDLLATLREIGAEDRLRQTTDFVSLEPGEIAAVHGDWTTLVEKLVSYTQQPYTFGLYLIDPYGPMTIPLDCVGEVIRHQRHDAIINMPYRDLHKKTGLAKRRQLSREQEEYCAHYNRMFGSTRWQAIVQQIYPSIWEDEPDELRLTPNEIAEAEELEERLAQLYREALLGKDADVNVKSIRLLYPEHEMTMYYLYLTTHDADGALVMNELIWQAGMQEYRLRQRLKQARRERRPGGRQMSLFGESIDPPDTERERPAPEDVAAVMLRRISPGVMTKKGVYRTMADEPYFAGEIDRALTWLKRQGRVTYESREQNDAEICFLAPPIQW